MTAAGRAAVGPASDAEIGPWLQRVGVPGLVDIHVHFLPERVMCKVWAFFDDAASHYGVRWPIRYRFSADERITLLRSFGVRHFAPLVYPHKPGMARWLTSWVAEFADGVDEAVRTATIYPDPDVAEYLSDALAAGACCVKAHVQVGGYDPRDALLDPAWGAIDDAGVPVVVHCGDGPIPGRYTGLGVFSDVLARHPGMTVVLAHSAMPDFSAALALARKYDNVYLDTTMVGTAFSDAFAPLPADWPALLADLGDRLVLGTDFPNIPYGYHEQLQAIASWAAADDRLGDAFLRRVLHETPARLLHLPELSYRD